MKSFLTVILFFFFIEQSAFGHELPTSYPSAVEKLIFFKEGNFKVFYGGPVTSQNDSMQWMMVASFENEDYKTQSVYEMAFINCSVDDCAGAEIFFIAVSDVDIKLKNKLSDHYEIFNSLISGKMSNKKYIVVRETDFSITFYPEVFIKENLGDSNSEEKKIITSFLHNKLKTQSSWKDVYNQHTKRKIRCNSENEIEFEPRLVAIDFGNETYEFEVIEKIIKNDAWKLYYIIHLSEENNNDFASIPPIIRLDSGCVSGQIYNDESCDCLDQLHKALHQIAVEKNGNNLLIHIPAHDGRGFGTAPKAETEIYKRGGRGRVYATESLDTVKAAKLLYQTDNFDIRTYDGAAKILSEMNIKQVILLTDNIQKVNGMLKHGIKVIRKKTESEKPSCAEHLKAKKNANHIYFPD